MTVNLDFRSLSYPDALGILCAQLTRDLFAIAKFLYCTQRSFSSRMRGPQVESWVPSAGVFAEVLAGGGATGTQITFPPYAAVNPNDR